MTKELTEYEIQKQNWKDQIVKCSICGKIALQDQYGNGECNNCGWQFSKDEDDFEEKLKISYPMLVPPSRAREQYKKGLPFKASFEDFINGLKFYSEMTFRYNKKEYGVFFYRDQTKNINSIEDADGIVEFFENKITDSLQKYKSIGDFVNKANINGRLLKDIWNEVEDPGFMFCG